jgi:hypothetical protein
MYQIEKNIPIPKRLTGVGKRGMSFCDFLRNLKVNDSFVIPKNAEGKNPVYRAVHATASRVGIKVSTRVQTDGSVRVWRVQ